MGISSLSGPSGLQSSLLGIQRGIANVDRDSQLVSQAATSPDGLDSNAVMAALVDANMQAMNVEASARAFSIQEQVMGSLIDIKV